MVNATRKFILRLIGVAYIVVGLVGLAPGASSAFFSTGKNYNIFLGVMGLMALGAADLGGDAAKWFDFAFGLLLVILTVLGAMNFLRFGTTALGDIILNGLSAVALLYIGLILNHRLKQLQK